jgi:molybdopterin converting factor small subunit
MEIASLKEKVSELEVKLEAAPKEAVAAFKAEMLAKYEAQQASESDSEMALKDFLK